MKVRIKVYRFWYKISKCPHFSTVLLRNKELWTSLIHITLTLVVRLHLKQESTAPGLRREETRISSSWAGIYGLAYVILLHLRSCSHVPGGLLHSSKEDCSKRTPAVGPLSRSSWSLCCFIFDPPKLHRFPCTSDMQQLCSAQALCWTRSEAWLGEVVLWMAGCHLPPTETGTVQKQGCSGATGAAQCQAGQSGSKEKALSQCQPCNAGFFWVTHAL